MAQILIILCQEKHYHEIQHYPVDDSIVRIIDMTLKKQNCWEYMKCGREPGGEKVAELGVCRASSEKLFDGFNLGKNGGRVCFAVSGTYSARLVDGSFAKKMASCKDCDFFKIL